MDSAQLLVRAGHMMRNLQGVDMLVDRATLEPLLNATAANVSLPSTAELDALMDSLGQLLIFSPHSLTVMQYFRPLLLDLAARALLPSRSDPRHRRMSDAVAEQAWAAIARLLPSAPQLKPVAQQFLFMAPSPFDAAVAVPSSDPSRLRAALLVTHRLTCGGDAHGGFDTRGVAAAGALWNWASLWRCVATLGSADSVCALAMSLVLQRLCDLDEGAAGYTTDAFLRCATREECGSGIGEAAAASGTASAERWKAEWDFLRAKAEALAADQGPSDIGDLDGNTGAHPTMDTRYEEFTATTTGSSTVGLPLHPMVCNVCGVLLLRHSPLARVSTASTKLVNSSETAIVGGVVLVPSAWSNLRALAELVAPSAGDNRPVLLCGPPGSGKTSALRALVSDELALFDYDTTHRLWQ